MSTVLVLIVTSLIFLAISYIFRIRRFLYLAFKIPSPKGHIPFIGAIPLFLGAELHDIVRILLTLNDKYGKAFYKAWFGNEIFIPVTTPEIAQQVLNAKECLDKPKLFLFFGLPNATLHGTLDGWKKHRRILNPAFNLQVLKNFVPTFDEKSKKLVKGFQALFGEGEFDVFPHNSAFFLETILNAALDLKVDIMNHEDKEFYVQHFDE
jgi:cytochrome P450